MSKITWSGLMDTEQVTAQATDLTNQATELTNQAIEVATTYATEYGLKIIAAIFIFIIGRMIVGVLTKMFDKAMLRAGVDPTITNFAHNLVYSALLAFVILAALSKLGIQTTSFIAVLGAAGLAVGLALQGSLSNFAAGVMLILFRPFKVGDYIEAGGTAGTVEKVLVFSTQLKTPDNKQIIVPNGNILNGNITNVTANPIRRVDWSIGVSYASDLKATRDVFQKCIDARDEILRDLGITIVVGSLGDSSVNFTVRVWAKTEDYWTLYFALNESFKNALDEAGIEIPFPQMDVHLDTVHLDTGKIQQLAPTKSV